MMSSPDLQSCTYSSTREDAKKYQAILPRIEAMIADKYKREGGELGS
jgi:hypothetical protein